MKKPTESAGERKRGGTVFDRRMELRREELESLYEELYPGNSVAFNGFAEMLRRSWKERKRALRDLDKRREAGPGWYRRRDLIGMMLYVNAFAGTLTGVEEKLSYFKECGVNYLHLMPLLESPKGRSDGGYAVSSFRRVQPELGTMEDLESLADACRKSGIKLCLDFVMNHTSEDHEWAKRALAGEKEYEDRYFICEDRKIPDQMERTVPQVFPTTAPGSFTELPDGRYVMTTFYPYQWDLNYANPAVFQDMTENLLFLANRGMDVIRLDAIPYIWKELGTSCRNLPQVHTLTRIMRIACEIVCPGVLLLGEVVMEPVKVTPYFGTPERPECHLLYNVTTMATTWHTLATGDASLLRRQTETVCGLPGDFVFLNYLRCHDDIGWGLDYPWLREQFRMDEVSHKRYLNDWFTGKWPASRSRGELYNNDTRLGDARLCGTTASLCGIERAETEGDAFWLERSISLDLSLHAWMFSQSGIPVIYGGDEVGQLNDYSYHDDPDRRADSRYLHRGAFLWDQAELRKDPETRQGKLFQGIRRLISLRAGESCFDADAEVQAVDTGNTHILAISRKKDGRELLCLYNFAPEFETAVLRRQDSYTELMYKTKYETLPQIQLYPYGFAWLLREDEKE